MCMPRRSMLCPNNQLYDLPEGAVGESSWPNLLNPSTHIGLNCFTGILAQYWLWRMGNDRKDNRSSKRTGHWDLFHHETEGNSSMKMFSLQGDSNPGSEPDAQCHIQWAIKTLSTREKIGLWPVYNSNSLIMLHLICVICIKLFYAPSLSLYTVWNTWVIFIDYYE